MKFQLVFQFEAKTLADFDRLTVIEEAICVHLRKSNMAILDGHDFGVGEFNIFIHCEEPELRFTELARFIEERSPGLAFSAGYRAFGEDEFKILWPLSLDRFSVA